LVQLGNVEYFVVEDECVSVYDVATCRQKLFFVFLRLSLSFNIYECVYNRSSIESIVSFPLPSILDANSRISRSGTSNNSGIKGKFDWTLKEVKGKLVDITIKVTLVKFVAVIGMLEESGATTGRLGDGSISEVAESREGMIVVDVLEGVNLGRGEELCVG